MKSSERTEIKKFAVNFGDNDFYYAFFGVFDMLKSSGIKKFVLTKDELARLLSELLPASYLLNQNRFEYNGLENPETFSKGMEHSRTYLSVDEDHIYINDEILELLSKNWNQELFIFDLENINFETR